MKPLKMKMDVQTQAGRREVRPLQLNSGSLDTDAVGPDFWLLEYLPLYITLHGETNSINFSPEPQRSRAERRLILIQVFYAKVSLAVVSNQTIKPVRPSKGALVERVLSKMHMR